MPVALLPKMHMKGEPEPKMTRCDEAGPMHVCAVNLFAAAIPEWIDIYGSGVFIARGLILTARHNLEIFQERHEAARRRGECTGPLLIYAVQAWLDPPCTISYHVVGWSKSMWSDLAVVEVSPATAIPPNFHWQVLAMDLVPPRPGMQIGAFGFDRVEIVRDPIGVHARAVTSTGTVRAFHETLGLETHRGWRIQTNARFDGGMSGGPVVGPTGRLVGVVSEGLPATSEGEEHASFFPMLWQLMAMTVPDPRPGDTYGTRLPLLELAKAGVITAEGWERLTLSLSDTGEVTGITCPMEWLQPH